MCQHRISPVPVYGINHLLRFGIFNFNIAAFSLRIKIPVKINIRIIASFPAFPVGKKQGMVLVFLPAQEHLCEHFPGPPVLPVIITGQFRHILLCYIKPHFPGCTKHLPGCRCCLTAYIVFNTGKIITRIVDSIPQYMEIHWP